MDANEPGAFRPCLCFSRGDVDSCAARKWDRRCGCLDWSRMAVSVRGIFRPASIALLVALCGSLIIDVSHPNMVHAGTVGNPSNLDVFEADSSIQSSWWGGGALTVSQRFGCTDQIVEPPAPTGWCRHLRHPTRIGIRALICRYLPLLSTRNSRDQLLMSSMPFSALEQALDLSSIYCTAHLRPDTEQ